MSKEKDIYKTKAKKEDTYSYEGWLNSDNFLKRALAVVGYSAVGSLFVYAVIFGVILLVGILGAVVNLF